MSPHSPRAGGTIRRGGSGIGHHGDPGEDVAPIRQRLVEGHALGAHRQAVGRVLDVAPVTTALRRLERGPDPEAREARRVHALASTAAATSAARHSRRRRRPRVIGRQPASLRRSRAPLPTRAARAARRSPRSAPLSTRRRSVPGADRPSAVRFRRRSTFLFVVRARQ